MTKRSAAIVDLFNSRSLGAPEHAVGFVLWRVVHRYQRDIDEALEAVDLTHLQFTTLALTAWLGRHGDVVRQSEVARVGAIHPMQVSQMFKTLETKGMVSRKADELDTRAKRVTVTATGLAALRRALPLAIEVQERMFGAAGRPGGSLLEALLSIDDGGRT